MYRGTNKTAIRSQGLLLLALHELLLEKSLRDITVSELCSRSGVSRQTFYSLFGSKENMLRYELEQAVQAQKPTPERAATMTLSQMCDRYGAFVVNNYAQLQMLVESDLPQLIDAQFLSAMTACRESYVKLNSDEEREYAALFLSAGLGKLTQSYIRRHETPDGAELARLSHKLMSGSIYRR